MRAYKIAMTPPMGPVVIVMDGHLQEAEAGSTVPRVPDLSPTVPPQGDSGALREAAELLVNAERPVILVDRAARSPEGMTRLVELAEALQAPVVDRAGRLNFPTTHSLRRGGRRARESRARPTVRQHPTGRRFHIRTRRFLDRGASRHPATLLQRHKGLLYSALVTFALACGVVGYNLFQRPDTDVGAGSIESIAVLPFENVNADPELDYLGDGLASGILYRLTQLSQLKVTRSARPASTKASWSIPVVSVESSMCR